jgi:hypothetical protein
MLRIPLCLDNRLNLKLAALFTSRIEETFELETRTEQDRSLDAGDWKTSLKCQLKTCNR